MPDWRSEVRQRLGRARLSPAREAEVVEELAQHVQDRYEELRAAGKDEAAARAIALDECEGEDEGWPAEPLPLPPPIGLSTRGATMRGMLWQDVRYALRTCR